MIIVLLQWIDRQMPLIFLSAADQRQGRSVKCAVSLNLRRELNRQDDEQLMCPAHL